MKHEILSALGSHPWAETIIWYDSIDSTNTEAKRLAAKGAPHGTVVLSGHQTEGRGRMGRTFHSPAGKGIYLSVILRPQCRPGDLMHLTCAVGVAMCDAVEAVSGIRPGIKWINDLILDNRKLGGILTELSLKVDGTVNYAVVGIGINCSHEETDFPKALRDMAISLQMYNNRPIRQWELSAKMVCALEEMAGNLFSKKYTVMDTYRSDCVTIGKDITVHTPTEDLQGRAVDVEPDGGLAVRLSDGQMRTVQTGEVSVRGLYGYCQ